MANELAEALDPEALRTVLRRMVTGVTVITTEEDGRPWGMTVSAFTSVSLEPPLVLVCLNRSTATAGHVAHRGRFGINVLAAHQSELSGRCARPGTPKFLATDDIAPHLPGWSSPRVEGALVAFDASVESQLVAGTHAVVIGRITHMAAASAGGPLLYGAGRYIDTADLL
jgi:flavin reductase (DIM6/NTAB) family NADH-FMN oxidoreductase RutF